MKKIEDKIIKKVFVYETKKTFFQGILKIVFFIIISFLTVIIGQAAYEIIKESGSLDFVAIFGEDIEIIQKNLGDSMYVFFQETPKLLILLIFIGLAALIYLVLTFVKKYPIIRNRVKALLKFWFDK